MFTADVIVLGGGIQGLLAARELRRRGRNVTLLEKGTPGKEASWAGAGMVIEYPPDDPGDEAKLARLSVERWPGLAAALREEAGMDIEYIRDGWVRLAWTPAEVVTLRAEHDRATRLGQASEIVEGNALGKLEPRLGDGVLAGRLHPGGQV